MVILNSHTPYRAHTHTHTRRKHFPLTGHFQPKSLYAIPPSPAEHLAQTVNMTVILTTTHPTEPSIHQLLLTSKRARGLFPLTADPSVPRIHYSNSFRLPLPLPHGNTLTHQNALPYRQSESLVGGMMGSTPLSIPLPSLEPPYC